jgi:6-phosphogluconolactonase (cycloisomerase 2 family)
MNMEGRHMRRLVRLLTGVSAVAALSVWAAPIAAGAAPIQRGSQPDNGANRAVFVQTDNIAGNQVVAYHRARHGTLALAGTYDTGGVGGILNGSAVDHLASQGSLAYDGDHSLLFAVNAGSNTVSVFSVHGDRLALRQVVDSGGTFPVSVVARGDLVYVLNAMAGATVAGYRVAGDGLQPLAGSIRNLGLDIPIDNTQFTHTPGQVAFSPDGTQLIVTTKANGNDIDVFRVAPDGRLSQTPVVNAEGTTTPFAVTFDQAGQLVVAEAGTNALATFVLNRDGTVALDSAVPTGQSATCWVAPAGEFLYASNAGSASESGYTDNAGSLNLLGAAATDPGTVDAAASHSGRFLYVQTGGQGIVDEFQVGAGGALSKIGSVTVAGAAGGEGIVAF